MRSSSGKTMGKNSALVCTKFDIIHIHKTIVFFCAEITRFFRTKVFVFQSFSNSFFYQFTSYNHTLYTLSTNTIIKTTNLNKR